MAFCNLRQRWSEVPEGREGELTEYIKGLMRDCGVDPHHYTIKYQPVPDRPSANGGYDYHSNTIYIHPRLLEDDEPFGDTIAAETAAHEVRHAMQDEVYYEEAGLQYPVQGPTELLEAAAADARILWGSAYYSALPSYFQNASASIDVCMFHTGSPPVYRKMVSASRRSASSRSSFAS